MLVHDYMTRRVSTVAPDTAVGDALKLLGEREVRQLPVVDGKRVVGMVTDRDLRGAAGGSAVGDVMTRKPTTISPTASFDEAARLLKDGKFNALPVVDDGELVGIVSTADILAVFVRLSGVSEPSYRLILKVPPKSLSTAEIRTLIEARRGEVRWLHRGSGKNRNQLHIRLAARNVEDITLALEGAGCEVSAVIAGPAAKI